MVIDLTHNKIVAATVSEAFSVSFRGNLVPKLYEKYGNTIELLQMYEDHIADGFTFGGEFYYPLTVVTDKVNTQWIKWKLSKGKFEGNSPYAFLGAELDFVLVDEAPEGFEEKLAGRSRCYRGGSVKLRVETALPDITVLSGKYSQTFVDEMARQLTPAIEGAMSVEGLCDSTLELCLVFAPESYMEHTSENVTYRRLLLTDNSGAPRDFWIKWTRLDGATAYNVAANPASDNILFEIGEDVNQKVREKEYRFLLLANGKDKYHNAMGRKNITEWREIVKRAVRRGELKKVEIEETISKETDDLTRELMSIVGAGAPASAEQEVVASRESDEELMAALEFARSAIEAENLIEEEEESEEESDELEEYYKEEPEDAVRISFDEEEEKEVDELARLAKEALLEVEAAKVEFEEEDEAEEAEETEDILDAEEAEITEKDSEEELEEELYTEEEETEEADGDEYAEDEDPCAEEYSEIDDEETLEEEENEDALEDLRRLEGSEDTDETDEETEEAPAVNAPTVSVAELEEKIRAEIEAKLRLEYERDARRKAEQEAERLRRENEKLLMAARNEEARKAQIERERLEETEKLKSQIEAQLRAEARERERLAEAARAAVEEQRRLEEEKAKIERMRQEEEKRLEAEARARAIEEERAREAERIRRETEERIRAEYEEKERAFPTEEDDSYEDSREDSDLNNYVNPNYTYVSKNVKLLFRRSVDPNITGRIHEIIKATLDYYGKSKVYLKIKATVPDTSTVILEFVKIPMEEMELLGNIIKVLGNSGLGIAKAIVE